MTCSHASHPFFRRADRQQLLLNQLRLWCGTRWAHAGTRPNEMKCGITGDCLFWVHVFKAIGALPEHLEIPDYGRCDALQDDMARLKFCIEATERAHLAWSRPVAAGFSPRPETRSLKAATTGHDALARITFGDVLLFRNGMSGAHTGLVVKGWPVHFVHLSQNGLLEEPLDQTHWLNNLAFVYRLLEYLSDQLP